MMMVKNNTSKPVYVLMLLVASYLDMLENKSKNVHS